MGRDRYYFLRKSIDKQCDSFQLYLYTFFPKGIIGLLDELSKQADVYIFSGVIKNFLLGFLEHRDLDLVISHTHKLQIHLRKLRDLGLTEIKRNKFDGVKLVLDQMEVDIWRLEDTKGIVEQFLLPTPENLIKTSFFNFSAIVYDFKNARFVYGDDFCRFLLTKELDVVYEENPFVESCIVSTMYYAEKYDLSIGHNLCRWIVAHYADDMDFQKVQMKRFGNKRYSNRVICGFVQILKDNPKSKVKLIKRTHFGFELELY